MFTSRQTFLITALVSAVVATANGSGGRRFRGGPEMRSVEALIHESLTAVGNGTALRQQRIERVVGPVFQALPRNADGRLAPKAVQYLVHNYFAMKHGWSLKGLDQPFHADTESDGVHDVNILKDKVPAVVEGLLESQHRGKGLNLTEVVAMVAVLEQIIVDESVSLLQGSYRLNGFSTMGRLREEDLHEIMMTYLILFRKDERTLPEAATHQREKALLRRASGPVFSASHAFEQDNVLNFAYAHRHRMNAFVSERYTFEMAAQVVTDMAEEYGKWQHSECMEMKDHLMELDERGFGRVPLHRFHAQPRTGKYSFSESADALREYGALDETIASDPQVIIANYIINPTNCIADGAYFSVCCVSECEGLMNELAAHVQAPFAEAELLHGIIANLSSSSVDAPRVIRQPLVDKLHEIAGRHGGMVPLHSRLFAQWMHFAFPAECPYPSHGGKLSAEAAAAMPDLQQWSDVEEIPLLDETRYRQSQQGCWKCFYVVRLVAWTAAVLMALRGAVAAWTAGVQSITNRDGLGKGMALPVAFSLNDHAKSV
mmetsp:Transcript_188/g.499  ORF Transcript_188/g.499 Transcript_188/m.499 type:complete len:545 (+) Transcript_188:67-1701(+)